MGILIRERNACSLTRLPRRKEPRQLWRWQMRFAACAFSHRLCVWRSSNARRKTLEKRGLKKRERKRERGEKKKGKRTAQKWNAEISCEILFFFILFYFFLSYPRLQPTSDGQENWTDDFPLPTFSFVFLFLCPNSYEGLINNATNLSIFIRSRANKLDWGSVPESIWNSSRKKFHGLVLFFNRARLHIRWKYKSRVLL